MKESKRGLRGGDSGSRGEKLSTEPRLTKMVTKRGMCGRDGAVREREDWRMARSSVEVLEYAVAMFFCSFCSDGLGMVCSDTVYSSMQVKLAKMDYVPISLGSLVACRLSSHAVCNDGYGVKKWNMVFAWLSFAVMCWWCYYASSLPF
ncbi:unnamed protein product [Vicia faba]|uniref:Uncharacterized protein n=1 Tax=Vicia faba TaxID=3906 RepID=A0AAV0ZQE6_VICFA|nr:unnamed protein product [Vicia faba]